MKKILLILINFVLFSACSKSGKKALENGNYYAAALQSIDKLNKDTDNSKAGEVLSNAYKLASNELLTNIKRAKQSDQLFKIERVFDSYQKLNELYTKIEDCNGCRRIVSPVSYFTEMDMAQEQAAIERYAYAENLLKNGTIESARAAYDNFEDLFRFAPTYKDVVEKKEFALFEGSVHVVIEPPVINSKMFQYSNEFFIGRIEEYLQNNKRLNKFIRFYQPNEAQKLKLKPDHIVKLEFIDFSVGDMIQSSDRSKVTGKDSIKTGTAKIDGKNVDVYGLANATIIEYKKSIRSRGTLNMEIIDFKTSKNIFNEQLQGEFIWNDHWATYNGDERALSKAQLALSNKKELMPPNPQAMFIEFCRPIYDQFTYKIKRFYEKY